jgi:site-specific DNA-cytosine methylase
MKMLDLFAGTRSISRAFERRGWETYSVELDTSHPDITYYGDVYAMSAQDMIDLCGGVPDVVWASPVCDTYSVA